MRYQDALKRRFTLLVLEHSDLVGSGLLGCNVIQYYSFVGAFAKLVEATVGFVISVRPSVPPPAWNTSVASGRILMKLDI
jgi:hypothetical protein